MNSIEMADQLKILREAYEERGKHLAEQFVTQLFLDYHQLNFIMVRGWTPGFNDGDPCEHSQDVFVSAESFHGHELFTEESDDEVWFDYNDAAGIPYRERYTSRDSFPNKGLPVHDADAIEKAFNQFDDAFESIYGTNWQLNWTRKEALSEEIVFTQGEYDCGH